MKKASKVIHCLAWVLAIGTFMVGNVFAMELIFKDAQYSFQTLRVLGYAVSGGADVGEVLNTAYSIKEGDDERGANPFCRTLILSPNSLIFSWTPQ